MSKKIEQKTLGGQAGKVAGTELLQVRDLRVWYPLRRGLFATTVGHVKAVDGVTFNVRPGETMGLVGESGCGKTSLGRALLGLETIHSGQAVFEGQSLIDISTRQRHLLCRRMQMVFQDPYASLNPRMTILDIVTEGLVQHGLLQGSQEQAAISLLDEVGLSANALYRYPFEFSGGQRQRVSLARVLALRPAFIVCDEAVSALDVSVQAQILNLLQELKERHNLAYLFISHDLGVVKHISDRVAVMYFGRLVEEGPTDELMANPRHPYTQALLNSIRVPGAPRQKRTALSGEPPSSLKPPSGCSFHPRCPRAMEVCRQQMPAERRLGTCRVWCHLY